MLTPSGPDCHRSPSPIFEQPESGSQSLTQGPAGWEGCRYTPRSLLQNTSGECFDPQGIPRILRHPSDRKDTLVFPSTAPKALFLRASQAP